MITVKQTRDKDGRIHDCGTRHFEPLDAVTHITRCELEFGAEIVEVSESSITFRTVICGDIDTTICEGEAEEMKPLLELVYYYTSAVDHYKENIFASAAKTLKVMSGGGDYVNPMIASMASGIAMGGARLKVAMMLACGLDESDIEFGLDSNLADIVPAIQLSQEMECSFQEAITV